MTDNALTAKFAALYESYGYARYTMSKFEEYSLYVKNRDSLISEGVITFTDRNGKLMALKPDVTMSIIKNGSDSDGVCKVYYNENVYRVSKGTQVFKEIMQSGLECIGANDCLSLAEVLRLACKSLEATGKKYVLDVSNLAIIALAADGAAPDVFSEVVRLIGEKNLHELEALCTRENLDAKKILMLASMREGVDTAFEKLYSVFGKNETVSDFERVVKGADSDSIVIDFSTIDDINYYNGIVFKGFCENVPQAVLSGGQYDLLMKRMGRKSGAVGFAVYLDLVDTKEEVSEYDADVLILYNDKDEITELLRKADALRKDGKSVCLANNKPVGKCYREVIGENR